MSDNFDFAAHAVAAHVLAACDQEGRCSICNIVVVDAESIVHKSNCPVPNYLKQAALIDAEPISNRQRRRGEIRNPGQKLISTRERLNIAQTQEGWAGDVTKWPISKTRWH